MKAIAYLNPLPVDDAQSLIDVTLPIPKHGPNDLLVEVSAVSINPVDAKVRRHRQPAPDQPEVLGWDAVGTVRAAGTAVTGFQPGDRVYYAGAINRPGCQAQFHAVDARLVGHAPSSLSDAQAAALPLTTITAWELLFDRLGIAEGGGHGKSLLIVGAAGGVGSILVQLARQLTRLKVIATAGQEDSRSWVQSLGAHHVIDHRQSMTPQLVALGLKQVDMVASLTHTDQHWPDIVDALAPQGQLALIDDPASPLDVMALKRKSLSLHWELMFTRSLFETADMRRQGELLSRVSELVNAGTLKSTLTQTLTPINAANARKAHALIESGKVRGKLVLSGFPA
jgi:zinc-binding alcohol dehydrogenase family protein